MFQNLSVSNFDDRSKNAIRDILAMYFGKTAAEEFSAHLHLKLLPKHNVLMDEGMEDNEMYILISGSLEVSVRSNEGRRVVGKITKGECVGEMALLGNSKRSARVVALRNSILVSINKKEFDVIQSHNTQLLPELSRLIIERLGKMNARKSASLVANKFIALISLHRAIDLYTFSEEIKEYWMGSKKVYIMSEKEMTDLNEISFALKINELEEYDYVFMLAGEQVTWNERILLNADKSVYLGFENDLTNFNQLAGYNNFNPELDEVILCYDQSAPENVAPWLKQVLPQKLFRKRIGHRGDMERIIRMVCELPVCVVFGGGGAHGLSNLGVIRALREFNIPIDIIGGTSIGSIFAGAYARDWDDAYIYKNIELDISKNNPLSDYTLPFIALLKGKRMKKVLKRHFDLPIEHCWKNMFCVASNLSQAKTEVIQDGPLDMAIACSIAIPGILPPQLHRNSLLIDGGVLNNMPTDIMRSLYPGPIISVDVVSAKPRSIDHKYPISNIQFIKNLISGNRKDYVPSTMNTLMKAITLASAERSSDKEAISAFYIKPKIKKGFLAWKEMDAFVTAGYNTTIEVLKNSDYRKLLDLPNKIG